MTCMNNYVKNVCFEIHRSTGSYPKAPMIHAMKVSIRPAGSYKIEQNSQSQILVPCGRHMTLSFLGHVLPHNTMICACSFCWYILVSATSASFVWSLVLSFPLHRTRLQTHMHMNIHKHTCKHMITYMNDMNEFIHTKSSQGFEREAGEPGGEREQRPAAAHRSTPNQIITIQATRKYPTSKRGGTSNLSNRRPQPTADDTKRRMQHSNTRYNRTNRSVYVQMTKCVTNH